MSNFINLVDNLSIKKLEISNELDMQLAKTLDKDELITGREGYLWSIEQSIRLQRSNQLNKQEFYDNQYAIYLNQNPIGYLEISKINSLNFACLAYALLKEERGHGYATKTMILEDKINEIKKVLLVIDMHNIKSQNVTQKAGFILANGIHDNYEYDKDYCCYTKDKYILKRELKRNPISQIPFSNENK